MTECQQVLRYECCADLHQNEFFFPNDQIRGFQCDLRLLLKDHKFHLVEGAEK